MTSSTPARTLRDLGGFDALADEWRAEAAILRRRGAAVQAEVLEGCAAELEQRGRDRELQALTLEQAAAESGFSYSALEKMVRRGKLANVGRKQAPRIRRGDLPRKLRRCELGWDEGIAALTLAGRQT